MVRAAAIYARISADPDDDRLGVTRQLQDQDIKANDRDAVVVWHLDRLHRRPKELEEFFEVCDAAGVTSLATVTGDMDLGVEDGRLMARILGAVASKESADKSRRLLRMHLELAESGPWSSAGRAHSATQKIAGPSFPPKQPSSERLLTAYSLETVLPPSATTSAPEAL